MSLTISLLKQLRKLTEKSVRGLVLKRHLPTGRFDNRPVYVSPDTALKHLKIGPGAFDQTLLDTAEKLVRPNSVVWDVGANIGTFSIAAAVLAPKVAVFAFEPDIFLNSIMRKTLTHRRNQDLKIELISAAISHRNGTTRLQIAERSRNMNTISDSPVISGQRGSIRQEFIVPTLTLDTCLEDFPAPNLVKIDVEGAEALVIQSASTLLSEVRPIFYIEVAGENLDSVTAAFLENRYKLFDGDTPVDTCAWNTTAVPIEQIGDFSTSNPKV